MTIRLIGELVERWAPRLADRSWIERYETLQDILEKLREDLGDTKAASQVFPPMVAGLIRLWGESEAPVTCMEQARVLAISSIAGHRALAETWWDINEKTSVPKAADGPQMETVGTHVYRG